MAYYGNRRAILTPAKGGGVPAGFSLWTTNGQPWFFGSQTAISPARPQ